MNSPIFLYGPLAEAGLLAQIVQVLPELSAATLENHSVFKVRETAFPAAVAGAGTVSGVVIDALSEEDQARLSFFAGGQGYTFERGDVLRQGTQISGQVLTHRGTPESPWDSEEWHRRFDALSRFSAAEAMMYFGQISARELARRMPMIDLRAGSRVRAQTSAPHSVRSDMQASADVQVDAARRPYSNYFVIAEDDLRFRRFDGGMSETVNRAGFVGGDAVTVLPYDPRTDQVLLVEQFRAGPFFRGDPLPWMLEPVAGRVDPGETVESTARREAEEEAGLALDALHFVNAHYPSPGAVTEYVYVYVATATLGGAGGRIGGLESEAENIRTHVIPFDQLMELVETGEAGAGPLVISAYWLALNRARLRDMA